MNDIIRKATPVSLSPSPSVSSSLPPHLLVVLGTYSFSHSFFVIGFFEVGSQELFA
jgi:hypothetical protein